MNWKKLKEFANSLDEKQLENKVILWREDEAIIAIECEALPEDHYINKDEPESGCFPVSEAKHLDPDTKIKKVYDKGHPVLWEKF
jgi:hypothetical protein